MIVKIELAQNLDKSISSYTGFKRVQKLSTKDIFEESSKDLKMELNTIPLCSGRFVNGPL